MDKKEEAVLFPTVGAAEGQLPYNYYEPIIPYQEPQCNSPEIKFFSEIEETSVDWLWYPYIPFGKVTIIQGDPGEGKTTLALNIAAILSRGERLPTESEYEYTYDSITPMYLFIISLGYLVYDHRKNKDIQSCKKADKKNEAEKRHQKMQR